MVTVATFELLGWPDGKDGRQLRLDHERFAYAGKFVMTNTGKAVARDNGSEIVAAVAFNLDRTEPETLWLRYVTVARERRGDGLGPRLCAFVLCKAREASDRLHGDHSDPEDPEAGVRCTRARIAVNNPFAYEALYRVGFAYTGRETGIAELVLERPIATPADRDPGSYRAGLTRFQERDLSAAEMRFLDARDGTPPDLLADV